MNNVKIPPPRTTVRMLPLILSVKKVDFVVLLNPYSSSIATIQENQL